MHYYVVGVSGSGKTTLLSAISRVTGIYSVHGTTELMKDLGIPGDYSRLRAMDQSRVLQAWGKTAARLAEENADRDLLLDTHLLNLTNGRIIRRDGPWIAEYDALVQVSTRADTILARIAQNNHKDRALFPLGMSNVEKLQLLGDYQQKTNKLFLWLCRQYELPSLVIDNNGDLSTGVSTFIQFHDSLVSTSQ